MKLLVALAALLSIEVCVLADCAYANQVQITVGDPDPGTGARRGDPDQPQVLNPWCAGCAAGFWWLCPGCNGLGPKGWALGDWF